MARSDRERVDDILGAIADIRADTAGMDYAAFSRNPVVIRSVLYSIGVIGESVKGISPEFKAACTTIPWRAISGMRDRIVHEYFRTNIRRVWDVVEDEIDPLENALRIAGEKGEESPGTDQR
ncbi:HepT-like ribonuclease domain-containing protein [Skermanella pratensis]|uniref:HepT-like ribonuclease domain-containing protein n=1 Tax=Skermanella pratensis TaxID=2233999 RepID=UPI001300FE8A|nr:DUF86 domain-containing protein [Skermanella pratensis]